MLRPLLSIASALSLASLVAASDPFDHDDSSIASLSAIEPYTLNLSCAECAFSYSDCSENVHPDSYLSITFSTNNDTLLANNDIIFPASMPMKFFAQRHWAPTSHENVPVAYALEMQPLPHQPDADLGDLYHLKLSLVDMQGRPATERAVSLGMIRSPEGTVRLVHVEESTHHLYHHELPGVDRETAAGRDSWWRVKTWKSYYITYLQDHSRAKSCDSAVVEGAGERTDVRVVSHCREHQSLADWSRNRHYMRHMRPVLLPALLGLVAGVVACVMGFVVGKLIVAVYVFACGEVSPVSDVESVAAEDSLLSEKARLMEAYSDRDANNSPHSS
ncbi:hypothetical protein BJY00DRAFT_295027 [Aspergillus carlsbadensis]|nr:hypothetical protein BJY00DRAFT_295027 [Aspergillus carlsbadensis]